MKPTILEILSDNPELGSRVERAYDEEKDRVYIIKRIRYLDSPLSRTIFQKESAALTRLKACDNIVRLYNTEVCRTDSGSTEGVISMEYVPGETLYQKMVAIPSTSIRYQLVRQLVNSVRHAHENSIIHRDINPSNVLITDEFLLKLIDFGIAKIRGSATNMGTTYQFATKGYSAPEVTQHSEYATERSDIYSVGAVIFYLFTGITPPDADEIEAAIEGAAGIDESLKKILMKMCAKSATDRYENIDDCEVDLVPLYQHYCNNNEHYYISIPIDKIEALRNRHMVPYQKKSDEIINDILPQQFTYCNARVRDYSGKKVYYFDGINITMECDFRGGVFHVGTFKRLDAFMRQKNRRFAFPLSGTFHFVLSTRLLSTPMKDSFNDILFNRFDEFEHNFKSERHIDNEYDAHYGIWNEYVHAMIQNASARATRINYTGFESNDGLLLFHINEQAQQMLPEESFTQETVFVIEKAGRRKDKPKLIPLGNFLEFRDDGSVIVIKGSGTNGDISASGHICVDYRKDIGQYNKQEQALEDFRRSETNNSGNLKSIFVGIDEPGQFHMSEELTFFNQQLDITQKNAVRKILEADDIALIQGPPGTGKTNVLVEVVRQVLRQNQINPASQDKLLIVSQSHAAVDKILEDLQDHLDGCTTIRIGAEENIVTHINEKYGLDHCEQYWAESSVQSCRQRLNIQLAEKNIEQEDFHAFAEAMENIKIYNNTPDDNAHWREIIVEFETTYHLSMDSPFLAQCLAMDQWCRHLIEDGGLGEYYIKDATIVAGTCSGFIANPFVKDTVFDYVIVDEAAKATLPELMVPLVRAKKVILVGDHRQLPPVFNEEAIRQNSALQISELEDAGFGRLWEFLPDDCKETLSTQYRMHPCIGDLISQVFYGNTIQNGVPSTARAVDLPFLQEHPITWISTSSSTDSHCEQTQPGANGSQSFTNPYEITVLQRCLARLDQEMAQSDQNYSIGIITPYRAQLELIRRRLRHTEFKHIKVDVNTVDAFQGSQRDIIIYSTVRSNAYHKIGFLSKEARLNVSLSRAKRSLIIIGDAYFFSSPKIRDNIFRPILGYIKMHPHECNLTNVKGV